MSDDFSHAKVEQSWEPGTLESTRKNIGPIDREEAARMTQVLGGEIKLEKSVPIDYSAFPQKDRAYVHKKTTGKSSADISSMTKPNLSEEKTPPQEQKKGQKYGYVPAQGKSVYEEGLPEIAPKEKALMDKLMMSADFQLKQNYGIFNFVRRFKRNGTELLKGSFVRYTLKNHIEHYQNFITTVKSIIQSSPDTYKSKIVNNSAPKFKFLRTVGSWTMKNLKMLVTDLQQHPDEVTVAMTIPVVKLLYSNLLKIYYIGENAIPQFFKEIYADLMKYPKADQAKFLNLSKQGITEWLYVYTQIIKGMYPLLMRMCSPKFEFFPAFFTAETANIFSFLGISKFDVILPENKKEARGAKEKNAETEKKKQEEEKKKVENSRGMRTEVVDTGFKLLETLFPDAGFSKLETHPDMYPYFQPIYQFRDGYNMLHPQNPLQVTVTLLRIVEDFFQGCRNIVFNEKDFESGVKEKEDDKFTLALNEFSVYREDLFERQYGDQLRDFVNQEYTQGDFKNSLFGKRMITTMLWQTKYNFLPHFEFEQLLLEKPINDAKYIPLCLRTDFLRKKLTMLSKEIDAAAERKGAVPGIENPWEGYVFDIPNAVSKRLDVLLGAKKQGEAFAATNANLIKYALCIVSVLDWWVNNHESPAYSSDTKKLYRISEKDGGPAFSVPVRSDQNKLFAANIKAAAAKSN